MMIDPKAQFALWAQNPNYSENPEIVYPVAMPVWESCADLERAAERWRSYKHKKAGWASSAFSNDFHDALILKPAGTMEVCMPAALASLGQLIENFLKHDLAFFTDTASRVLDLSFVSDFLGHQFTGIHIDDDDQEIEGFNEEKTLVSRGVLVSTFASTIFYPDGTRHIALQEPVGVPMLYRGDTPHESPKAEENKSLFRVVVRLLLRDPHVKLKKDYTDLNMPSHIERRIITDRPVFTFF